jgi:hypothetical protein
VPQAGVQEYDIVGFTLDSLNPQVASDSALLGCVIEVSADSVVIDQLEETPEETYGARFWTPSGMQHTVPVTCVFQKFDALYSQRMDQDRVSNPHGEHAHEVWEILEPITIDRTEGRNA